MIKSQDVSGMSKSELRQFASECEDERKKWEQEEAKLNGTLRTAELDVSSLRDRLFEAENQLYIQKLRDDWLTESNKEFQIKQKKLVLLSQAKQAHSAAIHAELLETVALQNSVSNAGGDAPVADASSDFLKRMSRYGSEFGNHFLALELAAIHVPWQVVESPGSGYSSMESIDFGRMFEMKDIYYRVLEPFDVTVKYGSEEGKQLFAAGTGHYMTAHEAEQITSWNAEIVKGKLMTLNFGNGKSEDFFLKGIEQLDYRQRRSVAWNQRLVLSLVDENQQGIQIDLIDWKGEFFMGISGKSLELLGAGMDFAREKKVGYFLNGSRLDHPGYDDGLLYETYQNRLTAWSDRSLRVMNSDFSIDFLRPEEESCDGAVPVYPDLLLFRVIESDQAAEAVAADGYSESEVSKPKSCQRCVPLSRLDEFPSLEPCKSEKKEAQILCSELAMMDAAQAELKYPPIARDAGIQGVVNVRFVVNQFGKIVEVQVVQPVDKRLDAEAVRVVSKLPVMTPAIQDGEPVSVEMCLPVRFSLQ